jgi:hypothetical protein
MLSKQYPSNRLNGTFGAVAGPVLSNVQAAP